ncbi:beta-galactosidase [Acetatifactor muris]|uniref:Beta-galactosidase n=1 Tax=Acetatifactor muris TaxID=879566 RepID=A0A2K4ZHF5_9FIRM|nr:beta-galactosidase [Acetatifactor muris]MCR2048026.1 beta-galactosidase [Acetatifactor muris]SOY29900.1 Beta-galactosidase BglY [Acetatifactor muris]
MEKKMLFPQTGALIHGGDYNPEQWLDRPDILEEDVRLMKKAGMNSATLGVFSWSVLEPREGEFHFEWLEEIVDRLYQNGIYTVLATPSGARPAWLDEAYPEAMRVNRQGMREHHGGRHNHCMTSPKYREKVTVIDRKLAERLGSHPGVIMYHISNEFGGECFCPLCIQRFQEYLAEKYDHDIDKLNAAWWTAFWSHRYNRFDQIEPPFASGENSVMGLNLEWKRFTTWNTNDFMKHEISVLRSVTPDVPVTANFMRLFGGLDYRKMAPELDVVSWDNYPLFHNDWETFAETMCETAFQHAVMRSLKRGTPFMMMESAPGLVNWQPVNKVKRPGVHRLACLQAVAGGSDTVQYFQWRKGRGSFEQFHGAVVDHIGTDDTRVFREVAQVGELLKKIAPVAGTLVQPRAALLFDWDNRWAIEDVKALAQATKKYEETCIDIWKSFFRLGVDMDVVGSDEDLSAYDVVVAPMLYLLQPGTAGNLKAFVERGGQLLATYFTGYVNADQLCYLGGFPGDGLKDLFGIISEEIDSLYPSDRNGIQMTDGTKWEVKEYAEILQVQDAQILGRYTDDFYGGSAAVTCKNHGRGNAYYVAARTAGEQMLPLFEKMLADGGIPVRKLPGGVEYHVRSGEEGRYEFYLNCTGEEQTVSDVKGKDLVTDTEVQGTLTLQRYGAAVVKTA